MFKKAQNPWTIWLLALVSTLIVFGTGYGIVSVIVHRQGHGARTNHATGHAPDHHSGQTPPTHEESHGEAGAGHENAPKENHNNNHHNAEQKNQDSQSHENSQTHKAGPSADHEKGPSGPHSSSAHPDSGSHAAWSYSGSKGPAAWGDLDPRFATCKQGKKQSPIDIDETQRKSDLLPIRFLYKPVPTIVKNTGHHIEAEVPKHALSIEIEGERYDLQSYSLRTPSEHRISGQVYDAEIQLVHRSAQGTIAVIAVLVEEGKALSALDMLLKSIPEQMGESSQTFETSPMSLLPPTKTYFTYQGSLTSPPCSEGVNWFVLTQSVDVSSKQMDMLAHYHKNNVRPVQKLSGRSVYRSTR